MIKIAEAKKDQFKGYDLLQKLYQTYMGKNNIINNENNENNENDGIDFSNINSKIIEREIVISKAVDNGNNSGFTSINQNINRSQGQNQYDGINDQSHNPINMNKSSEKNIPLNNNSKIENNKSKSNDYYEDNKNNSNDEYKNDFKDDFNNDNSYNVNLGVNPNNNNYYNNSRKSNQDYYEYKLKKTLEGHTEKVVSLIQLESGYIATGSYDSSIRIWDIDNGQCISYFYELGNVLCLLEFETNKILAGTSENNIGLWDLNNTQQDSIFNFTQHQLWVNCLVKCDEQHFASASNDANIIIWNYKNRKIGY